MALGQWFESYDLSAGAPCKLRSKRIPLTASSHALPTDRELRHHRQPANRRTRGDGCLHRLSFRSPTSIRRRFSPRLLDDKKGGQLLNSTPLTDDARRKQLYLLDSNILLSRFLSPGRRRRNQRFHADRAGSGRAHDDPDAMPPHQLVRRAKAVRGEMKFRMCCAPRFNYARSDYRVEQVCEHEILFICEDGDYRLTLRLHSNDVPISHDNGDAVAEFTLRAGQTAAFILEEVQPRKRIALRPAAFRRRKLQAHAQFLACLGRSGHVQGPLARDGQPFRARAQAADQPALRLHRRRAHFRVAGERRRRRATGITATRGFATLRSRSTPSTGWATTRRPARSWVGSSGAATNCSPDGGLQMMYGIDGRHDLTELIARPPRRLPRQLARARSATARPNSCSSTSTAS